MSRRLTALEAWEARYRAALANGRGWSEWPQTAAEFLHARDRGLLRPEMIPSQRNLELLGLPTTFGRTIAEPATDEEMQAVLLAADARPDWCRKFSRVVRSHVQQ